MNLGPLVTLPNMMSFARVGIVPLLLAALAAPDQAAARPRILILLALAFVTDWFDGRIARWTHSESGWGRILDPIADKLFVAGVAIGLVLYREFPVWVLLVLLARDAGIVIAAAYMTRRGAQIPGPNLTGKIAMCVFSVTLLIYALPIPALRIPFVCASLASAVISSISYARRMRARRVAVPSGPHLAAR